MTPRRDETASDDAATRGGGFATFVIEHVKRFFTTASGVTGRRWPRLAARQSILVERWLADTIRHFWGSELLYAPTDDNEDPRHLGTLEPLWNLFDLTPDGRPRDWYEQLNY
jgi:predicted dithiol-disulfide oxidoreductase (DUF899 family)